MFDNLTITTPDPRQAWGLDPENGATMVDIHAVLRWNAGEGATEHRVYFSQDEEAVVNRTVAPTILPVETTELAVGPLILTNTYYWAVDEVVNPVIPGENMSFTVEEYRTIDDFESYDVGPEALPPQVFVPGEIIVEAVPPPEQELRPEVVLNEDAVICNDPDRGQVLCLSGGFDYVDCGNPAALNFGTGNWTLSAWVRNTMTGTGDANKGTIVANGGDTGGGHRYALIVSEEQEGEVTLVVDDDATKVQARGDATQVNDDAWHHVLGLREGDEIRIYIDGMHEATAGLPAGYDLSGTVQHNVLIGAITDAPDDNAIYKTYGGMIDEVRIYDSALSMDNIAYLLDGSGVAPATGPLAHWAFDGDFTDSSGNGFHGTPKGYTVQPAYYGPLLAQYEFEGNADDSTDNNYDGSLIGDAIIADGALTLDGDGDAVTIPGFKGVLGTNAFTISAWLKKTNTEDSSIVSWGRNAGRRRVDFRLNNIRLRVEHGAGNIEGDTADVVTDGEWHHVALTVSENARMSNEDLALWLDGSRDTRIKTDNDRFDIQADKDVGIGYRATHNNRWYNGSIDDVRIYDYELSEGEIRYIGGHGHLWAFPDSYQPLALHYEFEGNLDDSSGNNRTGTAFGAVGFETDPVMGDVLDLPGGDNQYVAAPKVYISGNDHTTIACWAKADHTSIPDWTLIFGFTTPGGDCGSHFNIGSIGGPGGVGAHTWCSESTIFTDVEALDWRHYAMSWDGGTVRYYGDGIQIGQYTHGDNLGRRGDYVNVGKRNTQASSFPGNVDDARVYNIVLTLGQIRNLADYVPTNDLGDTWSGRASAAPSLEYLAPAHEGSQSMKVTYSGSGAVSRLEPFGDGKHPHGHNGDFSLGTAQALALWFKGHPDNAPGAMFAQLTTVVPSGHTQRVMYDGDPEDLQIPEWQEWTMSLKALSTGKPADPIEEMGLPITKIKDVGVGVIGAGGGVLHFDDLRLYPVRCVPKYGSALDFTDDWAIDRADLGVIMNAWLAEEGGNGLWYEAYEGDWNALPYFPGLPRTTQGKADNFGIGPRTQNDFFGLRFTGIVTAPVGGDYKFFTSSDDGSKLYINGTQVVDNDGLHGMQWREGTITLMAGEHEIEVIMFEKGGGEGLQVEVEGPGIPRMPIPNDSLSLAPGIPADVNGDGIVNFLDYADMINHLGDEVPLFPPPEEQL
jgi:hypothetical protein